MSGSRIGALVAVLVALVAYGALAERGPDLSDRWEVAFQSFVVLPAFLSTVWIGLPLARNRSRHLFVGAGATAIVAIVLTASSLDAAASVAKLACYALLGFWFATLFEHLWWLALVAVLVPSVDVWSVAAGPTEYVVEQRPSIFDHVAVTFAAPGEGSIVGIGPPDILFFALFLAAAVRFGLRVGWTWFAMSSLLGVTLVAVWAWEGVAGLPALPAVCLGFLAANADLLWRDARDAWHARHRTAE